MIQPDHSDIAGILSAKVVKRDNLCNIYTNIIYETKKLGGTHIF